MGQPFGPWELLDPRPDFKLRPDHEPPTAPASQVANISPQVVDALIWWVIYFFFGGGECGWVFSLVINLLCCMFCFVSNSCFCMFCFCVLTYVLDGEHQTLFGTLYPETRGFHFFQLDLRLFFKMVVPPPPLIVFHHQTWAKFLKQINVCDEEFMNELFRPSVFFFYAKMFWR